MQRILLLEDDAALGSGIRLALQSPEIQITVCRTLAEARDALAQTGFDLLILDVNLPDGSGLTLLTQVRCTSAVPVILLTANDMEMNIVTGLESGVIALHPAPGPLAPMLASAVSQLAPKAEAKGVQIIQEAVQANAVFDPKWTEEAVYNLLDNAVKYTPAGGAVRIGVAVYPMFCAISVSDTGPGIPEDEQPRVFQRFYRGLEHQTEEGVGIGLYLVRRIAERQGGYVKVSSRPGAGSTFSLYLPGA